MRARKGMGGGQGSPRLVNWAKGTEEEARGQSPEEGGQESGLSHRAMSEGAGD